MAVCKAGSPAQIIARDEAWRQPIASELAVGLWQKMQSVQHQAKPGAQTNTNSKSKLK